MPPLSFLHHGKERDLNWGKLKLLLCCSAPPCKFVPLYSHAGTSLQM